MGGGDVGRDGEPEAGAAAVAAAALVEAHEALDDVGPPAAAGCRARRRRRRRVTSSPSPPTATRTADAAWRAALATTWSTARRTAAGVADDRIDVVADRDVDRHAAGPRRDVADDVGDRERAAVERPLVAAGEQQEVVDEALQPVELVEQHGARRVPVRVAATGGRPRARRASRRPACAARGRRRRRGAGSSSSPTPAGRASRSSSSPARRSRRATPAPAPARAASASRSRRPAT